MTAKILRIVPDPVLRETAKPVLQVDAAIGRLMDDMLDTMYAARGIGLAAPQIGILERVIVMDVGKEQDRKKAVAMANPEIFWSSEETFTYNEGCLSIPEQYAEITRPKTVRVRYLDPSGKAQELEASDLFSSCIQHEIDHLNGVLFIDYLSPLKRGMLLRRLEKARRHGAVETA